MPLTRLQARVAQAVARLPEAQGFAMAGGGALVVLGIVDRPTEDLDFFATAADAVDRLTPVLQRALGEDGLDVLVRRSSPGFTRLEVGDGADRTAVDLAWDMRLTEPQATDAGPVLANDDLAADKTLALFGRAEARDFVDVFRLRAMYERCDLLRLAAAKDAGFSPARFAEAIAHIDRHHRSDFPVDDDVYGLLRSEFAGWLDSLELQRRLTGPRLTARRPRF